MSSDPINFASTTSPDSSPANLTKYFNWEKWVWFDLQWGHRVGTVALIALFASLAGAIRNEGPYGLGLAAAVIIADIGLIGGILAWWSSRRLSQRTREPLGVIIFNLVILLLAAGIYAAGQFGYLAPAIQRLTSHLPAVS